MPYYPETTVIQSLARVVRERELPAEALPRTMHMLQGGQVEAVTTVLAGDMLRDYRILDVAAHLRLHRPDPDDLARFIVVREEQRVEAGEELARRGKGRRARVLKSPADGLVVRIENGLIFLQVSQQRIAIQAKIPGEIEAVETHRVRIRGTGAIMQCAWGNGGFAYTSFQFLPEDGFEGLSRLDPRMSDYRERVIISIRPLTRRDLQIAQQHQAAGVVAPSMPSNLREFAKGLTFPVLLTEGFGQRRPTALIYTLLRSNMGRQAAFDAAMPDRWPWERPEIVIPLPSGGAFPPVPALDRPLAVGAQVRLTRAPWQGLTGRVVELPPAPQVIGNGLRVPGARVQLANQQVVLVPLANLELLG